MTNAECRNGTAAFFCILHFAFYIGGVEAGDGVLSPALPTDEVTSQPSPGPHGGGPHLAGDLAARDFEFNYDQPAFYSLLEKLRREPVFPPAGAAPYEVGDWRELLARPADFRGQAVQITGTLRRNKDSFRLLKRPELGSLTQLELEQAGNPLTATVICTQDVSDLPVGSVVEVAGYFVLVRNYYTETRRVGQSAVIVAPGPLSISTAAPAPNPDLPSGLWSGLGVTFVAALAVTWFLIRRSARTPARDLSELRATEAAPFVVSEKMGDE